MKKILFTAAAAAMLSCSSDDNNDNNNVSVEGTWELTKFELTEEVDLDNDGSASPDLMDQTDCFTNSTIVFEADNSVDFNIEGLDIEIQPVEGGAEGEYEYVITCEGVDTNTYTYTTSDNVVTVDTGTLPIALTRDGNKLTFALPQFGSVPVEQNGEVVMVQTGAYLEFTKQ